MSNEGLSPPFSWPYAGEGVLNSPAPTKSYQLQPQPADCFIEHLSFLRSPHCRSFVRSAGRASFQRKLLAAVQVAVLLTKFTGANDLGFEAGDRQCLKCRREAAEIKLHSLMDESQSGYRTLNHAYFLLKNETDQKTSCMHASTAREPFPNAHA